jgi:hypothetical protein
VVGPGTADQYADTTHVVNDDRADFQVGHAGSFQYPATRPFEQRAGQPHRVPLSLPEGPSRARLTGMSAFVYIGQVVRPI